MQMMQKKKKKKKKHIITVGFETDVFSVTHKIT